MPKSDRWRKILTPLEPIPSGCAQRGKPRGKIVCMVFDIYGTLFISGSGDIRATKRANFNWVRIEDLLHRYRIEKSPKHLLSSYFSAIESEHIVIKKKGIDYPEVDVIQIWRKVLGSCRPEDLHSFAFEFELIINPVYPMPHLGDLLSACKRSSIKMGIISNAQFYTPILFEIFFNRDVATLGFDPDLTVYSYQIEQAKPSAALFELMGECLDKKGIPRSSTLFMGNDMRNDIRPAHAVGFQTALFAGDARSLRMRMDDVNCRGFSADMVITDLNQLVAFLEQ